MLSSDGTNASRWIERTGNRTTPRFRMFCFPYAGGTAAIFRDWAETVALDVEICAIRLPGREGRHADPPFRRAERVAESLTPILQDFLDLPFVMFGHSMGAILAYEITRAIRTATAVEPRALLVSAHRAPHLPRRGRDRHDLPREQLIAELKALNGTPAEVFQHDDLLDFVLPILRSDLELVESWSSPAGVRLSCPVVAFAGSDDRNVSAEEVAGWAAVTSGPFRSVALAGDHFFINSAKANFLHALRRELGFLGLR